MKVSLTESLEKSELVEQQAQGIDCELSCVV